MEDGRFAGLVMRRSVAAAIRVRAERAGDLPVVTDAAAARAPERRGRHATACWPRPVPTGTERIATSDALGRVRRERP